MTGGAFVPFSDIAEESAKASAECALEWAAKFHKAEAELTSLRTARESQEAEIQGLRHVMETAGDGMLLAIQQRADAEVQRRLREMRHEFYICPECGPCQRVDEDGCCVSCGADPECINAETHIALKADRDRLHAENDALQNELKTLRDPACPECPVCETNDHVEPDVALKHWRCLNHGASEDYGFVTQGEDG